MITQPKKPKLHPKIIKFLPTFSVTANPSIDKDIPNITQNMLKYNLLSKFYFSLLIGGHLFLSDISSYT